MGWVHSYTCIVLNQSSHKELVVTISWSPLLIKAGSTLKSAVRATMVENEQLNAEECYL